jgi:hypothetical protein
MSESPTHTKELAEPSAPPSTLTLTVDSPQTKALIAAGHHPSTLYLAKPPNPVVLEEDEYIDGVAKIIQRDFFPDLERLKTQKELMQAIDSLDYARAQILQAKLSRLLRGEDIEPYQQEKPNADRGTYAHSS